jgi:hypothetical protein
MESRYLFEQCQAASVAPHFSILHGIYTAATQVLSIIIKHHGGYLLRVVAVGCLVYFVRKERIENDKLLKEIPDSMAQINDRLDAMIYNVNEITNGMNEMNERQNERQIPISYLKCVRNPAGSKKRVSK